MRATSMPLGGARRLCLLVVAVLLSGCPGENGDDEVVAMGPACPGMQTQIPPLAPLPGMPPSGISLQRQPINVSLNFPLFATAPPADTTRLFVVEKGGAIKIVDLNTNTLIGTFLTVTGLSTGSEQGLLGLAFDPQYAVNRRFYVSYTDTNGDVVIARYLRHPMNPNLALGAADRIILTVPHRQFANHNGGMIAFGPDDDLLYIGLGDGGGGGDPNNRAQNSAELLGKLLRIDVSQATPAPQPAYAIPSDNPCVGQVGAREEIWSIGLRNPWRFSFDRPTGDLYIADVGQSAREEVSVSTAPSGAGRGINYGWRITEGTLCFSPSSGCSTAGLTLPVVEYAHSLGVCSITGGYVYRGAAIPALPQGTYFYADFCAGFVRSFRLANGMVTEHFNWPTLDPGGSVTSFGEDAAGELYIMTSQGGLTLQGALFRIVQ
jgi:glucose/arabinose dehydrogenase